MTRRTLGCGVKRGKLYYLELTATGEQKYNKACLVTKGDRTLADVWLWYRRLGHLSFDYDPKTHKLRVSLDVSFRETGSYYSTGDLGSPL